MASCAIRVRDRESGRIFEEPIFAEGGLRFLYGCGAGRALTWLVLKRRWVSRLYGWMQDRPGSRKRIPAFIERLGIDVSEAERPLADFRSMNDFFTRTLRPARRPVDSTPEALVSPADGRALVFPRLAPDASLCIKNSRITIPELLGDATAAQAFAGGSAVVVRLAPGDYHRFHFPESGVASAWQELGCGLHSVHTIALLGGAKCFFNQRMVSFLESDAFGRMAIVEVGAMMVGGIRQTYTPGTVGRGQEKGYFCFGASTVIVLLPAGRVVWDADLLEDSASGLETLVRMGTRIGSRCK